MPIMGLLAAAALAAGVGDHQPPAPYASANAALRRAADRLAVPPPELFALAALGEAKGMSAADVEGGVFSIGSKAHEAKNGRDNEALAAMMQLNLQVEYDEGRPLLGPYLLDLADVLARQRDPYTQDRICELLGCSDLMPVLLMGRSLIEKTTELATDKGLP